MATVRPNYLSPLRLPTCNASILTNYSQGFTRKGWPHQECKHDFEINYMKSRHLYISSGHNYFGHHGQPSGSHPIMEVAEIECVAGCGVRGDRFFKFKENYQGKITFFSKEVFDE